MIFYEVHLTYAHVVIQMIWSGEVCDDRSQLFVASVVSL